MENHPNYFAIKGYNTKWNKIFSPITNPKRLVFKGKRIRIKENPRIGVCNLCRNVVPFDCKQTQMHHEKYDENNPLRYTIEVCASCHGKLTTKHE
jgi:hypothetical protein